jgi:hypothetical protein
MSRISIYLCAGLLLACCTLPVFAQEAGAFPPGTITGSGTADFFPIFTGTTTIGNSKMFQAVGGNVGISTTTPANKLDVNGTGDFRDKLTLFPKLTHPALSIHGTAFAVGHTGLVTFVSGQTFPGTGTVTSVGSGAGLTGGPITHSGTLRIATGGVTNSMLQNSTITVNAGTDLTGGGAVSLGGSVTLNLDTSHISVGYSSTNIGNFPVIAASPGTLIAATNTIATTGTYYISASALLDINAGDTLGAFCYDTLASSGAAVQYGGSSSAGVEQGFQQAAITDVLFVGAGDSVQLWCYGSSGGVSDVYNAGITATLINSADVAPRHIRHLRKPPGVK